MSTITVRYNSSLEAVLHPVKEDVRKALIAATTTALSVEPSGVIVEFIAWAEPFPQEAPEVLFRAETSVRRRELLRSWGTALITTWNALIEKHSGLFRPGMRVAAKPYVIDSEWIEEKL